MNFKKPAKARRKHLSLLKEGFSNILQNRQPEADQHFPVVPNTLGLGEGTANQEPIVTYKAFGARRLVNIIQILWVLVPGTRETKSNISTSCLQLGWAGLNQVLPVTNPGAHQASGGHYHERVGEE